MYNGKFAVSPAKKRWHGSKRTGTVMLSLLLLLTFAISGTVAYLATSTGPVENKFLPGTVTCEVTESFDGTVKSNVNVKNTGTVDAYLRVKLVSYRVNDAGQIIGGDAPIPAFPIGAGWVEKDGYYYYTSKVAPEGTPKNPLIGDPGITLENYLYTFYDGDGPENDPYGIKSGKPGGGKQVIEVMAEAIQAEPTTAVLEAWGVDPETLS